jgi:protein-arginine kinase activator protein McsA
MPPPFGVRTPFCSTFLGASRPVRFVTHLDTDWYGLVQNTMSPPLSNTKMSPFNMRAQDKVLLHVGNFRSGRQVMHDLRYKYHLISEFSKHAHFCESAFLVFFLVTTIPPTPSGLPRKRPLFAATARRRHRPNTIRRLAVRKMAWLTRSGSRHLVICLLVSTLSPCASLVPLPQLCSVRVRRAGCGEELAVASPPRKLAARRSNTVSLGLFGFGNNDNEKRAKEEVDQMVRLLQLQAQLQVALEREQYNRAKRLQGQIQQIISGETDELINLLAKETEELKKKIAHLQRPHMFVERMEDELNTAIIEENYTQAAALRDQLRRLTLPIPSDRKQQEAAMDIEWLQGDLMEQLAKMRKDRENAQADPYLRLKLSMEDAVREENYEEAAQMLPELEKIEQANEVLNMMQQLRKQIDQAKASRAGDALQTDRPDGTPSTKPPFPPQPHSSASPPPPPPPPPIPPPPPGAPPKSSSRMGRRPTNLPGLRKQGPSRGSSPIGRRPDQNKLTSKRPSNVQPPFNSPGKPGMGQRPSPSVSELWESDPPDDIQP